MTTLGDVTAALDALYPPELAEPWDAVGLVCGDPSAPVRRVLLAVDPTPEVAAEAVAGGYDLLLTHHPLYLGGTTTVAGTDPKGRVVHDLVRAGSALFVAHTNADRAAGGVSDALAALFFALQQIAHHRQAERDIGCPARAFQHPRRPGPIAGGRLAE